VLGLVCSGDFNDLALVGACVAHPEQLPQSSRRELTKRSAEPALTGEPQSVLDVLEAQHRCEHDVLIMVRAESRAGFSRSAALDGVRM